MAVGQPIIKTALASLKLVEFKRKIQRKRGGGGKTLIGKSETFGCKMGGGSQGANAKDTDGSHVGEKVKVSW